MRRYDLIEYRACGSFDKMMDERPDGDYVEFADLQARDLKMAELVGALPHERECNAYWDRSNANTHIRMGDPIAGKHCDCKLGEALALLEATNG